jgi:hypothetical protein
MVQRYRSSPRIGDVTRINIYPVYAPFDGLNAYGFSVSGLRVMVKLDPNPLPDYCNYYIINGKSTLQGLFVDFEETLEFRRAIQMVASAEARRVARRNASHAAGPPAFINDKSTP